MNTHNDVVSRKIFVVLSCIIYGIKIHYYVINLKYCGIDLKYDIILTCIKCPKHH